MDAVGKILFGMVGFLTKFVFVDRMCVIFYADECPAMIDLTIPNALVAFSLLCTFGSCRFMELLFRRHSLPRCMECVLDGMVTTYLTDVGIRQIWIPALGFSHKLCTHLSLYLMELGRGDLVSNVKPLAIWMRRDAMELFRFGIALMFVYTMLHVTGVSAVMSAKYFEWFGRAPGDDLNWKDNPTALLADRTPASCLAPIKSEFDGKIPLNPLLAANRAPILKRSKRRVSFQNFD